MIEVTIRGETLDEIRGNMLRVLGATMPASPEAPAPITPAAEPLEGEVIPPKRKPGRPPKAKAEEAAPAAEAPAATPAEPAEAASAQKFTVEQLRTKAREVAALPGGQEKIYGILAKLNVQNVSIAHAKVPGEFIDLCDAELAAATEVGASA